MLRKDLEEYLSGMNYKEVKKSSFQKEYQLYEDSESDKDKIVIEYKFNKQYVTVWYYQLNSKVKRFKGKLSQMSIVNNSIVGLKEL